MSTYRELGKVDVLVNNAGMSPLYPSLPEVTEDLFDKVIGVNLKGPFRLMTLVAPRMADGDGGSIINVSSVAAIRPTAGRAALRGGQVGARRPHRRVRPGVRTEGPGQHDHGRTVLHGHLQGVGPRCVPAGTRRATRWAAAGSRTRSSAPRSTSPATRRASRPARCCASTAARRWRRDDDATRPRPVQGECAGVARHPPRIARDRRLELAAGPWGVDEHDVSVFHDLSLRGGGRACSSER